MIVMGSHCWNPARHYPAQDFYANGQEVHPTSSQTSQWKEQLLSTYILLHLNTAVILCIS